MQLLWQAFAIVNVIFLAVRLFVLKAAVAEWILGYLIATSTSLFIVWRLQRMAEAQVALRSTSGIVHQYLFDVLYLTWFSQLLTLLTSYGYWILVMIPIFLLFKLFQMAGPLLKTTAAAQLQQQQPKKRR